MPSRIANHDHTARLKTEFAAAQDLVGKYMPGEAQDDEENGIGMSKKDKKLAEKAAKAKAKAVAKAKVKSQSGLKGRLGIGTNKVAAAQVKDTGGDDERELMREDTGFGPLRAEDYVIFRMLPKLVAYSKRSPKQARILAIFDLAAIALSAGSTLLGAFDMAQPTPLLVSFASVLAGWQAYTQMKTALKLTNSAVGQLERLVLWWQSLSMIEKRRPDSKERLVRITEDVISSAVPELAIRKQMSANDDGDEKT